MKERKSKKKRLKKKVKEGRKRENDRKYRSWKGAQRQGEFIGGGESYIRPLWDQTSWTNDESGAGEVAAVMAFKSLRDG